MTSQIESSLALTGICSRLREREKKSMEYYGGDYSNLPFFSSVNFQQKRDFVFPNFRFFQSLLVLTIQSTQT